MSNLIQRLKAWTPQHDDRVRPLLYAEAMRRDAMERDRDDAENVIAFLLTGLSPSHPVDRANDEQRARRALFDAGMHESTATTDMVPYGVAVRALLAALASPVAGGEVELLEWLTDRDNLILAHSATDAYDGWEVRRGSVKGEVRGRGATPLEALAEARRAALASPGDRT